MPNPTEISFDLNPDQMNALEPLFAMLEHARANGRDYEIWARILPQGIVDADLCAVIRLDGASLVVATTPAPMPYSDRSAEINSRRLIAAPPLTCYFGDGRRVSIDLDEKGETVDAHDNTHKLAA